VAGAALFVPPPPGSSSSLPRLNPLCLALSPVALAIVLGYSFRTLTASAPRPRPRLAIARSGLDRRHRELRPPPSSSVSGPPLGRADVIYSLQDEEFDRAEGLRSIPARFGAARALQVARLFHGGTLVLLYAVFLAVDGGWLFGAAVVVAGGFLVRQHRLVAPGDLSRVNAAFFTANGWLSVVVLVFGALDVLFRGR
jgi:4-hydroxybenzoate polyprenyltransferase